MILILEYYKLPCQVRLSCLFALGLETNYRKLILKFKLSRQTVEMCVRIVNMEEKPSCFLNGGQDE